MKATSTIQITESKKDSFKYLAEGRNQADTLLLVKRQDIDKALKAFNGFDKNLKFTVDRFENGTPDFLDLEICPTGLTIFRKNTHTGQYINMDSFTLW